MDLLVFALIVLLICGVLIWLMDSLPIDGTLRTVGRVVLIIIALILIVQRLGYL